MTELLFAGFGVFAIASAVAVVFARSPIYSAFSLILCFLNLSALYVLWGATFIAMVQVLIYTGAIVVLFVFVVMLLDLASREPGAGTAGWLTMLLAGGSAWLFALLLLRALNRATPAAPLAEATNVGIRSVSRLLFNEYLWPFEVLSAFLLALLVGIYCLARPESEAET